VNFRKLNVKKKAPVDREPYLGGNVNLIHYHSTSLSSSSTKMDLDSEVMMPLVGVGCVAEEAGITSSWLWQVFTNYQNYPWFSM